MCLDSLGIANIFLNGIQQVYLNIKKVENVHDDNEQNSKRWNMFTTWGSDPAQETTKCASRIQTCTILVTLTIAVAFFSLDIGPVLDWADISIMENDIFLVIFLTMFYYDTMFDIGLVKCEDIRATDRLKLAGPFNNCEFSQISCAHKCANRLDGIQGKSKNFSRVSLEIDRNPEEEEKPVFLHQATCCRAFYAQLVKILYKQP
ncbi:hypothetical protein ACJX0J_041209 [Zea mays]